MPLKVKTLDDLLTVIRDLPLDGVAVTMPLKQEVLPHLANMDPLTARIGACNTLRTGADGKLYGFNTDVAGIIRPLERRMRLKGARILVLGAGGAARAAVFGLVEQGAEVTIVNRTHEKAVALARKAKAHVLKQAALAKSRFDAIINTTPCGMTGFKQQLPDQGKRAQRIAGLRPGLYPASKPRSSSWPNRVASPSSAALRCLCSRARASLKSGPASPRRKTKCCAS